MKSRKARIMYLSDAPYFGGAEKYLEILMSGLERSAFELCLVSRKDKLGAFRERVIARGISAFETLLGNSYDVAGYVDFFKIVRRWKPDVLHVNLAGTYDANASLVAPIAWFAGCRRIVTTEHLAMVEKLLKRHWAKRFGSLFIKKTISITQSNIHFLTDVHGIPKRKIVVVYNGVDVGELDAAPIVHVRRELGLGSDVFLFAVVGSLIERKGHRFVLEALSDLPAERGSGLVIIGMGQEDERLRQMCRELGIGKRVFFLGQRNDVPGILREIDCLVVPSLVEGMPFVILEAMAASKPIIASKIYGIPEAIHDGETGLLVPPGDSALLAQAMERIAVSPELRQSMGAQGRKTLIERFTRERMVKEVIAVYESLLSGEVHS